MVVIAGSVLTKSGKVLMSRQFMSVSRHRIESLLASFPKLIGSESQHTLIETDQVRYLYQPLEQLYVVLITDKKSNIMEDLETLRIFAKLVPEYCEGYTEDNVNSKAFDLVFALDEVLNLGHKENVTLEQIKQAITMDSHEERLFNVIRDSKVNDARDQARKKAEEISRQKAEAHKLRSLTGAPYASSFGSDSYSSEPSVESYGGSGGSGWNSSNSSSGSSSISISSSENEPPSPSEAKKQKAKPSTVVASGKAGGMQLGKAKKSRDEFVKDMMTEEKLPAVAPPVASSSSSSSSATPAGKVEERLRHQPVQVTIEEKVTVVLEREGGVKTMEVNGEMKLAIFDPDWSKILVKTNGISNKNVRSRLHPKIEPKDFASSGVLALKDRSKGFPIGSDNAPVILKWKLATKDDALLPFTVNFWNNPEDDRLLINVEVEHKYEQMSFNSVSLIIPLPGGETPEVFEHDGDFAFDAKQKKLNWAIGEISDGKKASLEFSISSSANADSFFPLQASFVANHSYVDIQVEGVSHAENGSAADFNLATTVVVDRFVVE